MPDEHPVIRMASVVRIPSSVKEPSGDSVHRELLRLLHAAVHRRRGDHTIVTQIAYSDDPMEPTRIDSHQHFWRYDPVEYAWIDTRMSAIKRDFMPEDLKREMD